MGRLEKQIIIGALALVGLLLSVVVFKGLKPRDAVEVGPPLFIPLDSGFSASNPPQEESNKLHQGMFPDVVRLPPVVAPRMADSPEQRPDSKPLLKPLVQDLRIYTIQPHDTLSEIAQKELGSTRHLARILEANPGLAQDHLVPGETLVLPSPKALAEVQSKPRAGSIQEAVAARRTHTVEAGDSLWSLAEKFYGKGYKVNRIVAANPTLLLNKDTVLKIGWVLVVPE